MNDFNNRDAQREEEMRTPKRAEQISIAPDKLTAAERIAGAGIEVSDPNALRDFDQAVAQGTSNNS